MPNITITSLSTTPGLTGFSPTAPTLGAALDRLAPADSQLAALASSGMNLALESLTLQMMHLLLGLMSNQAQSSQSSPLALGGASQAQAGASQGQAAPDQTQSQGQAPSADAAFIDNYLRKKGSKAADQHFGELAVKYGKEFDVDPLVLLAIAGHETGFGKLGVGLNGLLGVGAYDSDPNNSTRNSKFSGVENQLRVGAKTFANLRKKGGASASDPIEKQLQAVNKAGWATDPKWHSGVAAMYKQIKGSQ